MVALEKAGIPAVAIAAQSFARAWQSCVDGWGQPTTAYVTIPHATTGQQLDFIRNMVDGQIDAIIQGLTTFPAFRGPVTAQKTGGATEVFTVEMDASPDGLNAVNQFLAERDWSDGIPVIPPTPELVERMLTGTSRSPQDVLMVMEPGFGVATVEKIAINAVMAGCRPEQFPVLLAAIDCLAQPEMNHRDMQVSGHTEAPLILVNGPIAQRAGINCGTSAMGPGVVNSANTSIGRALRLCLINIGYCKAGHRRPKFHRTSHQVRHVHRRERGAQPVAALPRRPGIPSPRKRRDIGNRYRPWRHPGLRFEEPQRHAEQHRLFDVLPRRRQRRVDTGFAIGAGGTYQPAGFFSRAVPSHCAQSFPRGHSRRSRV